MTFKRLRSGKTIETEKAARLSSAVKSKVEEAVRKQNISLIGLPDSEADIAEEIKSSGYYMLKVCHDMNEYFSVVSGNYKLSDIRIELCDFLRKFCEKTEPFAVKRGFGIMHKISCWDIFIRADLDRLCYTLANLILNAIENSPVGTRVKISVSATRKFAKITVCDKGFGMDEETKAHCCEPFFSKDDANEKSRNGLGLALAKHFAEESGGRLHIRSEEGRGTSVSVWLPLLSEKDFDVTVESPASDIFGERSRILEMVFAEMPEEK